MEIGISSKLCGISKREPLISGIKNGENRLLVIFPVLVGRRESDASPHWKEKTIKGKAWRLSDHKGLCVQDVAVDGAAYALGGQGARSIHTNFQLAACHQIDGVAVCSGVNGTDGLVRSRCGDAGQFVALALVRFGDGHEKDAAEERLLRRIRAGFIPGTSRGWFREAVWGGYRSRRKGADREDAVKERKSCQKVYRQL